MEYQPYTYLIKFKQTGQLYYGSKTAIGCHPDQFWVKYFTSSKVVEKLIREFGVDSFEVLYVKLHETKEDAMKWERLYLVSVDAGYNPEYLNKHNGGDNFVSVGGWHHSESQLQKMREFRHTEEWKIEVGNTHRGKIVSEESKELNRIAHTGANNALFGKFGEDHPSFGYKHTEEWKKEHSERMSGKNSPNYCKHLSEDHKQILKETKSKKYIVTFPDGHEEIIINMKEFCKNNNLTPQGMCIVVKGKGKHHKGFKCRYYIEPFIETPIEV
jgi:hypothetical protein